MWSLCTPVVPHTPSSAINNMLQKRCGKKYSNVVKTAVSYYICGFYQVVTAFYNAINPDSTRHSQKMWITACAVISLLIIFKAYLLYNVIMASAFVMHTLLYYASVILAFVGVGLGVSGAIFFDKEGEPSSVISKPLRGKKALPDDAEVLPGNIEGLPVKSTAPAAPASAHAAPVPVTPLTADSGIDSSPDPKPAEQKKLE